MIKTWVIIYDVTNSSTQQKVNAKTIIRSIPSEKKYHKFFRETLFAFYPIKTTSLVQFILQINKPIVLGPRI
jgi:hypothetical protein